MKLENRIRTGSIAAVAALGLLAKNCEPSPSTTVEPTATSASLRTPVEEDTGRFRSILRNILSDEPTDEERLEECKTDQAEAQDIDAMTDPVSFMQAMEDLKACTSALPQAQKREWVDLEDMTLKTKAAYLTRCQPDGQDFDPTLLDACEGIEEALVDFLTGDVWRKFEISTEPYYRADFETDEDGTLLEPGYYFVRTDENGPHQETSAFNVVLDQQSGDLAYVMTETVTISEGAVEPSVRFTHSIGTLTAALAGQ